MSTEIMGSEKIRQDVQGSERYLQVSDWAVKAEQGIKKVINDETEAAAYDLIKSAKSFFDELEDKRKQMVMPYNDYVKSINGMFKPLTDRLKNIDELCRSHLRPYLTAKEKARQEEQARIEEQNAKVLEKQNKKIEKAVAAGKDVTTMAPANIQSVPVAVKTTTTENGTKSTVRMVTKWRLVDINKVPREYLVVDNVKMNAAIKIFPTIAGIEVYQEAAPSIGK